MSTLYAWLLITKGYRLRILLSMIAIGISISALVGLLDLSKTIEESLVEEISTGENIVYLRKSSISVGKLDLRTFLPKPGVSEKAKKKIKNIEGVSNVYEEVWSRFPVTLGTRSLGNKYIGGDVVLLGVDSKAVESKYRDKFTWKPGDRVPVLAPSMIYAAYNAGFADANGLPRLSEQSVVGVKLNIAAGRGMFEQLPNPQRLEAEIIGVTSYGASLAAIVPKSVVYHLLEHFEKQYADRPSGLVVELTDQVNMEEFMDSLDGTGLSVSGANNLMEKVHSISNFLFFFFQFLGILIYAFSTIILLILHQNQLLSRINHFSTLYKLGVSRVQIMLSVALETILLISLVGMAAFYLGRSLALLALAPVCEYIDSQVGFLLEPEMLASNDLTMSTTLFLLGTTIVISVGRTIQLLRKELQ